MESRLQALFNDGDLERTLQFGPLNLIACDLDDTIYDGHGDFVELKERVAELINDYLPDVDKSWLIQKYEETEALSMARYGSAYHRLFLNVADMYLQACEKVDGDPFVGRFGELFGIIREVFSEENYAKKGLMPGSLEVLRELKANQINNRPNLLLLFTQGGHMLQMPKIKGLGLNQFFDSAKIIPRKTLAEYIALSEEYDSNPIVMIGNSRYHDIKPAIEAGFNGAVYIANEPWAQDAKGKLPEADNILKYDSMKAVSEDLPNFFDFLEKVLHP